MLFSDSIVNLTFISGMESPFIVAPAGLMTPTAQAHPAAESLIRHAKGCSRVFYACDTAVIEGGTPFVMKLAWLALAGTLGTLARYGLAGWVHRLNRASFPWGTVTVNLAGCFLAGLLWMLFESRWPVSGEKRIIVLVGFMGAFTTFSSMILETGQLLRASEWMHAAANLALQNGLGLVALLAGAALGRII